jgi:hemolysin activation/secretion protein
MLLASYPISKFTRLEGSFVLRHAQDHFLRDGGIEDLWLASNFLTFVRDNSRWTEMGPAGGMRWNLSGGYTRDLSQGVGDFFTLTTDLRRYFEPLRQLVSATRLLAEHSFGDDAERFYLGGRYSLSGYPRRFMNGHTALLFQQEVRFPLLRGLTFGFPARWEFPPISGALFADVGAAGDGGQRFERRASFGAGVYIGGPYFPTLRWNFVRRHDFVRLQKGWATEFVLGWNY